MTQLQVEPQEYYMFSCENALNVETAVQFSCLQKICLEAWYADIFPNSSNLEE